MMQLKVRLAADAFSRAEYSTAYELYQELSTQLGEKYFSVNLELCRRKLASNGDGQALSSDYGSDNSSKLELSYIDVPVFKSADPVLREKLGIPKGDTVVCYLAGLGHAEEQQEVLRSFEQLHKQYGQLTLLWLEGDTVQSFESRKLTDQYPTSSWLIRLECHAQQTLGDYYALSDLVILPQQAQKAYRAGSSFQRGLDALYLNVPVLVSSQWQPSNDYWSNAVSYETGQLQDKLEEMLPFVHCGKYKDDKLDLFRYGSAVHASVIALSNGEELVTPLTLRSAMARVLGDRLQTLSFDDEEQWCELVTTELSQGKISNALALAKYSYEKSDSYRTFELYLKALFHAQKYKNIVDLCVERKVLNKTANILQKKSESYLALFKEYFRYCRKQGQVFTSYFNNKKSVYFLHSSLPYFSGGYATRAHGLARSLIKNGLDVRAYTRPNFPYDVKKDLKTDSITAQIDGIAYHKTSCESVRIRDEATYMKDCVEVFDEVLKYEQPDYVHGRSTYQISLPGLIAAKKNGLPFVYEVSGLWEIVHESRDTAPQRKHETEKIRNFETMVAKQADLVFTLTGAMKAELISRGVEEEKIIILPNCTNPEDFSPSDKSQVLLDELGIDKDTAIIGYIGSFQDYEGLDDLILACELMNQRDPSVDFKILLVGDGPYFNKILELAEASSIRDKILLTGRVPHSLAAEYYSIVDIAAFPRKSWPVCEMVSPMKPLEALAMEKAVLVSSVQALAEMVVHEQTGMVFEKGSLDSLADNLLYLIANPERRISMGAKARDWVIEHRTWNAISQRFLTGINKVFSQA